MKDLIIFTGAPGSGKTTVAELLQKETSSPLIDFGDLRAWHLNFDWSDANKEEEMAYENLVFVIESYLKHGYKNILVTDLQDEAAIRLAEHFSKNSVLLVSLVISDEEELKKRVLGPRKSGFKNVDETLRRNKKILEKPTLPNEMRVDNAHNDPKKTVEGIMGRL